MKGEQAFGLPVSLGYEYGSQEVENELSGASMMAPDYAHWHGTFEVVVGAILTQSAAWSSRIF